MKTEIISLAIEIKKAKGEAAQFQFNETMVHAIISGLSVVYDEVFIWYTGNHLAVWVVGSNGEFLTQTFAHHCNHFRKVEMTSGDKSGELLENIILGKAWTDRTIAAKESSFHQAFELSNQFDCLHEKLQPLMTKGLSLFAQTPEPKGYSFLPFEKRNVDKGIQYFLNPSMVSADLFFPMCLN